MISAKIIADSKNQFGNRLTTMIVTMPRIILAEFNTHRAFCLAGDTLLDFDLPTKVKGSNFKKYSMTIKEFVEKWYNGVKEHKVGSVVEFNISSIKEDVEYTAKELSTICEMKSASNIRTWCRTDRLTCLNKNKLRIEDYLIKGIDFIHFMESRGNRTFDIKERLKGMNIRQIDENTGRIINNHIKDCTISGEKQLFKLKLVNGNEIKSSLDHKILTEIGWKKLEEITTDDYVIVQKFGVVDKLDPTRFKKINGRWVSQWIRGIKEQVFTEQNNKCSCCDNIPIDIHHIIPVYKDVTKAFDINNVEGLCKECHNKEHSEQDWQISQYLYGEGVRVESITKDNIEQTYDLEIEGEFANFIANNIVVHNSRNSASSRAIPFNKMVKSIEENPFIPIAWQIDHKGMQGTEYFEDGNMIDVWLSAKDEAVNYALALNLGDGKEGVTKQLCNRLLEPFMWHTVIVTASEWENFFALRCPQYVMIERDEYDDIIESSIKVFRSRKDIIDKEPNWFIKKDENKRFGKFPKDMTKLDWLYFNKGQAEIHMMALAEAMYDAYNESTPRELKEEEWHIPFIDTISLTECIKIANADLDVAWDNLIKISTVMCARVSYTIVGEDQKPLTYERMIQIHDEMLNANPKHMSPFEHCARVMTKDEYYTHINGTAPYIQQLDSRGSVLLNGTVNEYSHGWCGNFRGFIMYRKMIPNENIQ